MVQQKLRTFSEFMRFPLVLYKTIGEEIYEHRSTNRLRSLLYKMLFYLGFINFNLLATGEIIYFFNALKSMTTVLEATAAAPCIGCCLVADFKQIALARHMQIFREHLDKLEAIFPSSIAEQIEYKLQQSELAMKRVMFIFTMICVTYTFTFSLYPVCKSAIMYYLFGAPVFARNFGFFVWYPYDASGGSWLVYWVTCLSQLHAAYSTGVLILMADLMLVASVTQLIMHFDYISHCLENFKVNTANDEENVQFLQQQVARHAKCLELSEEVNKIFSLSLLLNFITASLTICFIAFQVTASNMEDIIKFCVFLIASLLQVFTLCYNGDELMTASIRVGDAAYNQIWFESSTKYKRMLVQIIMRSQNPASIRAPTFPPISINTYMKVISMSYQFFALLRTTYYGD